MGEMEGLLLPPPRTDLTTHFQVSTTETDRLAFNKRAEAVRDNRWGRKR